MNTHPLVTQLRFARKELTRMIEGVSEEDAEKRILPMNSIGWVVGHLASQEASYWLFVAQGEQTYRPLAERVGHGKPASTPPLSEMLALWKEITAKTDPFLDTVTPEMALTTLQWNGKPWRENLGNMLLRVTYHYFFHLGEISAARQMLGHGDLPEFVGPTTGFEWKG
jgi:hypothetical protein